jgi:hypothetical protein
MWKLNTSLDVETEHVGSRTRASVSCGHRWQIAAVAPCTHFIGALNAFSFSEWHFNTSRRNARVIGPFVRSVVSVLELPADYKYNVCVTRFALLLPFIYANMSGGQCLSSFGTRIYLGNFHHLVYLTVSPRSFNY